ncbi:MAG: ParB N-terminal domain-containing protein, partial [Taibaiella sp.]|nr:ParB N-terminal domain-containing protein [Taibaiella sp.]
MGNNALHDFLTEEEGDELVKLDLNLIDPNPDQDRYDWDDPDTIEHIESLKISIANIGDVTEPIMVIPSTNGRFMLIDGECRYRGALTGGVTHLTTIIKKKLTLEQISETALHT